MDELAIGAGERQARAGRPLNAWEWKRSRATRSWSSMLVSAWGVRGTSIWQGTQTGPMNTCFATIDIAAP